MTHQHQLCHVGSHTKFTQIYYLEFQQVVKNNLSYPNIKFKFCCPAIAKNNVDVLPWTLLKFLWVLANIKMKKKITNNSSNIIPEWTIQRWSMVIGTLLIFIIRISITKESLQKWRWSIPVLHIRSSHQIPHYISKVHSIVTL